MLSLKRKKSNILFRVLFTATAGLLIGCGIKGDPLPPEKPIEIGRGRPTYKRGLQLQEPEQQKLKQKKKKYNE